MTPYYPFTAAQWNAVAVVLKLVADRLRPFRYAHIVKELDEDSAEALERAKVAHQREEHSVSKQFTDGK